MSDPEPPALPPVLFGKYRLIKKVAQRGTYEIFVAKASGAGGSEKTVIIKRILPRLAAYEKFVRMFINEAKLTSVLLHPNIVQTFDFGRIGADYFIAMEFVDGKDLRSIVNTCQERSRKIPMEFVLYTGVQITKALQYSHSKTDGDDNPNQILHLNIWPQAVFVSRHGEIKLTGFGVERPREVSEARVDEITENSGYMSPEQAAGQRLDVRADVYAVAMVLYQLCTLRNPFADSDLQTVISRIKVMPPPPPSTMNPSVSRVVDQILLKGMEKNPKNRWKTAEELCDALSDALSDELSRSPTELAQASFAAFLNSLFPPELPPLQEAVTTPSGVSAQASFVAAIPPEPVRAAPQSGVKEKPNNEGAAEISATSAPTDLSPIVREQLDPREFDVAAAGQTIALQSTPSERYPGPIRLVSAILAGMVAGVMIPSSLQAGIGMWFPDERLQWGLFFWEDHWIIRTVSSWAAGVGVGFLAGAIARRRGLLVGALATAPAVLMWLAMGVVAFGFRINIAGEVFAADVSLGNQVSAFLLAVTLPIVAAFFALAGEEFGRTHAAHFDSRRATLLGVRIYHVLWLPFVIHLLLVQVAWAGIYFLDWFRIWYKDEGESYRGLVSAVYCGLLLLSLVVIGRGASTSYRLLSGIERRATRLRWFGALVLNLFVPPLLAALLQVATLGLEMAAARVGTLLVAGIGILWYFVGVIWSPRSEKQQAP